MDEGIKICISSRCDMFKKYYTVSESIQNDVDSFILDLKKLGEIAVDATDFEAKFAANGFQERFNSLLMRCLPKAYKMTDEEKQHSKEVAKEIFKEDRSRILKETAEDMLDHAAVIAEEELIAQKRKIMIEADVFDEYTRATNVVDIMAEGGSFLKKLFKKKK